MLCQAASKMAIKVMVLDPHENCPASSLSYAHMVGSYDDSATVEEFAKRSDFVCNTYYEFIYYLCHLLKIICTFWYDMDIQMWSIDCGDRTC